MLQIGDKAPNFNLDLAKGGRCSLSDYRGQYLLLYFFPRANTPGCTTQTTELNAAFAQYTAAKCSILGISPDSMSKQLAFQTKHNIRFDLGCDESTEVCKLYGVWQEKNLYGRKFFGVTRTSFLISPDGDILEIWRKVKVAKHHENVLLTLQNQNLVRDKV